MKFVNLNNCFYSRKKYMQNQKYFFLLKDYVDRNAECIK